MCFAVTFDRTFETYEVISLRRTRAPVIESSQIALNPTDLLIMMMIDKILGLPFFDISLA
jgi:hypothetical protein